MDLIKQIHDKARGAKKVIVLPESNDKRMLAATEIIYKEGLADIVLLGDPYVINKSNTEGYDLSKAFVINPSTSDKLMEYGKAYYEMRKSKGITMDETVELMKNPLYYACMMVKLGDADGMVAGAANTTGDVFRPAFQIIKTAPGISVVSSAFIMVVPDESFGDNGIIFFADCAINPEPTAEQLAEIAISTAKNAKVLAGLEPRVAMLSFSTMGSASHQLVDKVAQATKIAKEKAPDLQIDGEMQADAAIVSTIGAKKAPGSSVAGKANVLVFPDLASGNISYKLVQRLAKAEAVGPVSQGMALPINDLSRGCSVEDIVNVVAITAVQAQG